MFSAWWTQSDPEDSQSISIQVWRCLLGKYHPHTWHSPAFLWEPGQKALGFSGAESEFLSQRSQRRGKSWPVTFSPGCQVPLQSRKAYPGQGMVLCSFCLLLGEELPEEMRKDSHLPTSLLFLCHLFNILPLHDIFSHWPSALLTLFTLAINLKDGFVFSAFQICINCLLYTSTCFCH